MAELLDLDTLAEPSRRFALELIGRHPDLWSACKAVEYDGLLGLHLLVEVVAPAGPDLNVFIWMEGGDEPSLAFGPGSWHTHVNYIRLRGDGYWEEESLSGLLAAIIADNFVVMHEVGGDGVPFSSVLDLREPDAILQELTSPYGTGIIHLRSFSGRIDTVFSVRDPESLKGWVAV